jgi:hypothetical protein
MTIDYDRDQLSYALANALRERDEARRLQKYNRAKAIRRERERDEARERIAQLLNDREEAIQQSMRDAQRADANAALCSKLRDLAERAIEEMESGDPVGTSDAYRAELDKIKEGAKCPVCSPEQKCWECADDVSQEGEK